MTNSSTPTTFAALLDAYAKGEKTAADIAIGIAWGPWRYNGSTSEELVPLIEQAMEAAYRRGDADALESTDRAEIAARAVEPDEDWKWAED